MLLQIFLFIIQFESFSATAYFDRTHHSIGFGTATTQAATIDRNTATQQAISAIQEHYDLVRTLPQLSTKQTIALVSLSYNIGQSAFRHSGLYQKVQQGQLCAARTEFAKWIYQSGKKLEGLVRRRTAERKLFEENLQCDQLSTKKSGMSSALGSTA